MSSGETPAQSTPRLPSVSPRGHVHWWLRFASSSIRNPEQTWQQRNLARRSDLIAWLALGLIGVVVIVSPIAIGDGLAFLIYCLFVAGIGAVVALNRLGWVHTAGVLLVALISGAIFGYMLSSPLGLTMGQLPNYDALAIGVVVSATVLPRAAAFLVALLNSGAIVADYLLQPHNANIALDARLYSSTLIQTVSLVVRPIAFEFILAVVAYLWVRSMESALQRADRAEDLIRLERRERQRTIALEEGVRYLHQTLAQWAVGNLHWQVPPMPVDVLEQVRIDLNSFIGQFALSRRADFMLRRIQEDAWQLVAALERWVSGYPVTWPAPTGTPLDRAVELLQLANSSPAPQGSPFLSQYQASPDLFHSPWQVPPAPASQPGNPAGHTAEHRHTNPSQPLSPQSPSKPHPVPYQDQAPASEGERIWPSWEPPWDSSSEQQMPDH
jgi:hypothetical protein